MTQEPDTRWAPRLAALAGGASALTLTTLYGGLYLLMGASAGQAARGALAVVLPSALLASVTVRLPRRWPWGESGRGPALAIAACLTIAAAATAGWVVLGALDSRIASGAARTPTPLILMWQWVINSFTQLVVLGAAYAWHNALLARAAQERAQRAEALHARAELQLLRSQLNPHFVLNTLHALVGMVRRDPAAAEVALERLGELLRFGMSVEQRGVDRVALREEWAFVVGYLDLQRLRLGDRLHTELHADEAALDLPVPPFAIQPLVENAIAHAVAPRAAGGRLAVSVVRAEGRLRVEVQDDGPGATKEAILASPRLGLHLLRERLSTLYGGDARLDFKAAPEGGLRVVLDLPDGGRPEAP